MQKRKWIQFLFLALGLTLVGLLVRVVGIGNVWEHLARMGWRIAPIFLISAIWKAINTLAWVQAFPKDVPLPPFYRLYSVSLAGDVVNNLLPTANLGGELTKPYLLWPWMPMSQSLPAVMANKTMEILSGLLFVAGGVAVGCLILPLRLGLRVVLIVAVILGAAGIISLCLLQRNQPLTRLMKRFERFQLFNRIATSSGDAIAKVDESLANFYSQNRRRFWICLALRFLTWVLGTLEAFLILRLMDVDVSALSAFLLVTLPLLVDSAFFFVPANVGTSEASQTYVAMLLALDPVVGLSLALVRRFRRIIWVGIGMVLLYGYVPRALSTLSALAKNDSSEDSKQEDSRLV